VSKPVVLLLTLALSACAPQPEYASFSGMSPDSAIAVQSFAGITESGAPDSRVGELASEGATKGAAEGMKAGFDVGAGLTGDCGEFFVVCLGLVPVFGLAAMIGGVLVGSTAGLIEDLPYQSAEAMQKIVSDYIEEAPPNQVFSQIFVEVASTSWTIDPDAENKVVVAVIGVRPKKAKGKTLVFEVTTAMSVDYAATNLATKPYQFTTITAAYEIDDWIDGGQALYTKEVERAYAESAGVFTALLRQPLRQ